MRISEILNEYGAANGPPNLNKADIKRMTPTSAPAVATPAAKQTPLQPPVQNTPAQAQQKVNPTNLTDPNVLADPDQPIDEEIPTILDPNPKEHPHPADQALGAIRTLKKLSGIDRSDVENTINQELTNVIRSPQDPSSKNVSILNRLFGQD